MSLAPLFHCRSCSAPVESTTRGLRVEHVEVAPGEGMACYFPQTKGNRVYLGTTFKVPAINACARSRPTQPGSPPRN